MLKIPPVCVDATLESVAVMELSCHLKVRSELQGRHTTPLSKAGVALSMALSQQASSKQLHKVEQSLLRLQDRPECSFGRRSSPCRAGASRERRPSATSASALHHSSLHWIIRITKEATPRTIPQLC